MADLSKHDSCAMVVFGATGDLMHRKIVPAIYNLRKQKELPEGFALIGVARRPYTHDTFRSELAKAIRENVPSFDEKLWREVADSIYYFQLEFAQAERYTELKSFLEGIDQKHATEGNRVFYLATPPDDFGIISSQLKNHALAETNAQHPWHRVVFEKPFGHDLLSAKSLNDSITAVFSENQIFRIDHFLGKALVQNVIVLRFANGLFEPLWNRRYVDHVQISASESGGVGTRGGYYDKAGALRDMVQNHLLQLLVLVAMEAPVTLSPGDIQEEKVKVLRELSPHSDSTISSIRSQYIDGELKGERILGYRDEEKVKRDSETETFVSLKAEISNGRWQGVPFYLRTGKRMAMDAMEIVVQFKSTPIPLFAATAPNRLVIRIQPQEGMSFFFNAKVPGNELKLRQVRMDFSHKAAFGPNTPEAYERLIHDVMLGDSTLFTSWEEVEHAWVFVDRIIESWKSSKTPLLFYAPGTWGPIEADQMLIEHGHSWILPMDMDKKHR